MCIQGQIFVAQVCCRDVFENVVSVNAVLWLMKGSVDDSFLLPCEKGSSSDTVWLFADVAIDLLAFKCPTISSLKSQYGQLSLARVEELKFKYLREVKFCPDLEA